ncbi:MAG: beta-ketoacyl synthase N-terminal-like domain-containing protein, partial [Myxococcota bacterium]
AFAAAMATEAAARGVEVALQAGTAFLLTHEAAESGQVTATYQAVALGSTGTVLVGSTVNLPLRCVPSPFTDEARSLEARWDREGVPRAERRMRLEHHNLGRTRIAAKGIERSPDVTDRTVGDGRRYRAVDVGRQRSEGAFTVGQGAAVTPGLSRVAEIAAAMTDAGRDRLSPPDRPARPRWTSPVSRVGGAPIPIDGAPARGVRSRSDGGDIAVIGLGCVLPGALDVPSFFDNLIRGVDAVGPIPDARWRSHRYFDPSTLPGGGAGGPAKSYSRHAGVVRGFRFDPLPFRIPPKIVPTMDPSQRLALAAAAEAVRSAGLDRATFDRTRAAVVLGNAMGGEFAKSAALRVRFRDVLDAVSDDALLGGWSVDDLRQLEARVEERLSRTLPPLDVDSVAGLLSNVVAGRVAAWLDWMGGNLTVDAACAASLAAVSVAVDWLRVGRCDIVLAGGVDTDLTPETFVGFCRTHALSPTGSSPFSSHADGFVMGEGAAVLA